MLQVYIATHILSYCHIVILSGHVVNLSLRIVRPIAGINGTTS